jgi:hypothetical protein
MSVDNKKDGNIVNTAVNLARDSVQSFKDSAEGFMKGIRSRTIPVDGEADDQISVSSAKWATDPNGKDWRVKLSIPNIPSFQKSSLLKPLVDTGGLAFPYTPTIIMSHAASYSAITPVHSNYPFFAYQNSQVDAMTLTGQFYAQNSTEGMYWLGALHYLRSITKMFYGEGSNQGAPPPVVKLNGYGDYVFKDVPVIVTNFTLDMPTDVDYIAVDMADLGEKYEDDEAEEQYSTTDGEKSYGPTESQMTVTIQPIYSRALVEKFSLDKFAKGGYLGSNNKGFI